MKEYPCKICGETLNPTMCQSAIRIDSVDFPAHVACADAWAGSEIQVWEVTSPGNGSYYEEFLENVLEALKEMDLESKFLIKKTTMSRARYESLEEFQGF